MSYAALPRSMLPFLGGDIRHPVLIVRRYAGECAWLNDENGEEGPRCRSPNVAWIAKY
jgi:hypothetical protein